MGVKKPDPRIFDSALDRTGMKPKEVIYVGDTEDDTKAARAAGIVPILIQRKNEGNAFDFSVNKHNRTYAILIIARVVRWRHL